LVREVGSFIGAYDRFWSNYSQTGSWESRAEILICGPSKIVTAKDRRRLQAREQKRAEAKLAGEEKKAVKAKSMI